MKRLLTTVFLLGYLILPAQALADHTDSRPMSPPSYAQPAYNHGNGFIGDSHAQHQRSWQIVREEAYISKAQAIDIARHRTNGKILSADLVQKNQHAFYKVKVLTDQGRVKTLRINAQAKQK